MEKIVVKGTISGLPVINFHAAGIDVGSTVMAVSYTDKTGNQCLCKTGCFTEELKELVFLLRDEGIKDVAMEATGVYWMSLYEMLEDVGIKVTLINPGHYKKSTAPKTDENDSLWIHQYHSCGILRNSHIAEEHYRELRNYIHERNIVQRQKSETLTRIQRLLTMMNIKIQHIISDIECVGGRTILRAIASGITNAEELVNLIDVGRFKASREELVASLEGIYKQQFITLLKMKLQEYDFYVSQMKNYERCIEETLKKIAEMVKLIELEQTQEMVKSLQTVQCPPKKKKYVRKNIYSFDVSQYLKQILGIDLTLAEGMDEKMLLEVISVTGIDMSKWPTAQHFTSWLNLSPRRMKTGGKYIGNERRKTSNPATQAFRISAQATGIQSKGALGGLYRKLCATKGRKTATKAVARKLAVMFYTLVKNRKEYDPQIFEQRKKEQEEKRIRHIEKMAKNLGYSLQKIA